MKMPVKRLSVVELQTAGLKPHSVFKGLKRTNGQTSIRARQAAHNTGRRGVERPNQAEGLADQLKKRATLNLPYWYS
jgi:hypothetical protein